MEDGGMTLLQAHLLIRHPEFRSSCTLRVFAVVSDEEKISDEKQRIEDLLVKFRIEGTVIVLSSSGRPTPSTASEFQELAKCDATDMQEKRSQYYMILGDRIKHYSKWATLVITSLPVPRAAVPLNTYFAYLEMLSGDRPTLMIRGNQQTVLTYHS